MIFYELYPIALTIEVPQPGEDIVSIKFDQYNSDNFGYFKDPQELAHFSLSKFGKCGNVNCGPLMLGYEQHEQSNMNSNCNDGYIGDQCIVKCEDLREKSSTQAKCEIDGRWHQPGLLDGDNPDAAVFPHCIPKECAMPVPTDIENGQVTCKVNKGFTEYNEYYGQVGSFCKIECDPNFTLDYSSEATKWDKQKELLSEIECLFSQ